MVYLNIPFSNRMYSINNSKIIKYKDNKRILSPISNNCIVQNIYCVQNIIGNIFMIKNDVLIA